MQSKKIKDLTIYYDDTIDISYVIKVIANNYEYFYNASCPFKSISLTKLMMKKVLYISNFEEFFYQMIKSDFFDDDVTNSLRDEETQVILGFEYLIREAESELYPANIDISEEMLLNLIAYAYFLSQGTNQDFVNYLKYRSETSEIIAWLKETTQFKVYNLLLQKAVDFIETTDLNFFKHLEAITNKITEEVSSSLSLDLNEDMPSETVSLENLDYLFLNFLEYIKAPRSWFEIYQELRQNNLLIYDPNFETSRCFLDDSGAIQITIDGSNEIMAFLSLVHEFSHYLYFLKQKTVPFSLVELPSIFFEKVAFCYLQASNYRLELTRQVGNFREKNNLDIYLAFGSIYNDIVASLQGKVIEREEEILKNEELKKRLESLLATKEGMPEEEYESLTRIYNALITNDSKKLIDNKYYSLIMAFLKKGFLIFDGYQYLLDTILAEEILKGNIEEALSKMFLVTENLSNYTLDDILEIFELETFFDSNDMKKA